MDIYRNKCTTENVDHFSEQMDEYMTGIRLEKNTRIRIRFIMEDILLRIRSRYGEEKEVSLAVGQQYGRPTMIISYKGEKFDPTDDSDPSLFDGAVIGEWEKNQLIRLGFMPVYKYTYKENRIVLHLHERGSHLLRNLAIAAVAALVTGSCGVIVFPEEVTRFLCGSILSPIYEGFLGIMATIATLMIFLSIASTIGSIDDMESLGNIGRKMLKKFLFVIFIAVCIAMVSGYLLIYPTKPATTSDFGQWISTLVSFLPKDPVTPFISGDVMQLLLIGSVVGITILLMGAQVSGIEEILTQSGNMVQFIMEKMTVMMPVLVFIVLFRQSLMRVLSSYIGSCVPVILFLVIMILFLAFEILSVTMRFGISFWTYVRKIFPCFIISLLTGSAISVFADNMDVCEKKLGIDKKMSDFGVPMGYAMYKPMTAAGLMIIIYHAAFISGMSITWSWILMAAFISGILSLIVPPVPGASLACLILVMRRLDIPGDSIDSVFVMTLLFDFISTAVNIALLQTQLLRFSGDMDMLDIETLKK